MADDGGRHASDRPGGLAGLLAAVADTGANVIDVAHVRDGVDLDIGQTAVELAVEAPSLEAAERLVPALAGAGHAVQRMDPGERSW
jgi:threonine dehydratase